MLASVRSRKACLCNAVAMPGPSMLHKLACVRTYSAHSIRPSVAQAAIWKCGATKTKAPSPLVKEEVARANPAATKQESRSPTCHKDTYPKCGASGAGRGDSAEEAFKGPYAIYEEGPKRHKAPSVGRASAGSLPRFGRLQVGSYRHRPVILRGDSTAA